MKTKEFNASFGATAGCTMRLAQLAAPVQEGEEKPLVEGDAWFGSVTCAVELAQRHYDCVLQIKTNSSLFPKAYIETALENAPGGCKIVLTATHRGIPLVAIGYRYSTRTTLLFVATKNSGSTRPGKPYEMKFNDAFGNVVQRLVERPEILSDFFQKSNSIDKHNQLRQGDLALEKRWLTQDPYFRLHTTIIGMFFVFSLRSLSFYSNSNSLFTGINVIDTYKLCEHHKIINFRVAKEGEHKMPVEKFAGHLAYQLITNTTTLLSVIDPEIREVQRLQVSPLIPGELSNSTVNCLTVESSLTAHNQDIVVADRVLVDAKGDSHHQVSYDIGVDKKGKKHRKTRECAMCKTDGNVKRKLVGQYCFECQLPLCCINKWNLDRDCFLAHVRKVRRTSARSN